MRKGAGLVMRCVAALALLAPPVLSRAGEQWTPTSTVGAPIARQSHTAVWTGSRMIVWGGDYYSLGATGGVYHPATDTWKATSTTGAPSRRHSHTAVWTGSRVVVWGGTDNVDYMNTGGIYDPATDAWAATSTVGAPVGRSAHTAVWTGSRMIVWGGYRHGSTVNTGGIYDPATDTWAAMSTTGAPVGRFSHTAVWTGSRMIVWGGFNGNMVGSGAVYDPATDTWAPTSTAGAPSAREWHTAVWTGSRMVVWGGYDNSTCVGSGAIYDPTTDTWTATSTAGVPSERSQHTAVWTGSRMVVWGGFPSLVASVALDTGGIYDPAADAWAVMSTVAVPSARARHTAVWTGSRMIIWGGNSSWNGGYTDGYLYTGGIYSPPPDGIRGPLVAGTERIFPLVSRCGVPDGARSLSVNLTVTQPTTAGNLRVYAAGTSLPTVSSINYSAGQTRANNAIATPNFWGDLAVWCAQPYGTAHFILDVNGYFDTSGFFYTVTPCRLVDTRSP